MAIFSKHDRTTVFENRDALREEYQPETIVGREDQIEKLIDALWPVYQGQTPYNVLCMGPNGVGKTAVTHYVIRELQEEDLETELTVEWINCEGITTGYKLGIEVANRLLPKGDNLSSTGHSWDDVRETLFHAIEDTGGTVLLVLDEIGTVDDLDSILYHFSRARGQGGLLEETRLGFIGITTNGAFEDMLSPDTRSALSLRVIEFPEYDANQLREVLYQRESVAFKPGSLHDDVVPLAAAFGAQHTGDARLALDILLHAGDKAERNGTSTVTEEHVRESMAVIERDHVMTLLDGLNDHAKMTVYAMLSLVMEGGRSPHTDRDPRTVDIYDRYKKVCEARDIDPVSIRQVRTYLEKCEQISLIDRDTVVTGEGKHRTQAFKFDPEDVVPEISDFIKTWELDEKLAGSFSNVHRLMEV